MLVRAGFVWILGVLFVQNGLAQTPAERKSTPLETCLQSLTTKAFSEDIVSKALRDCESTSGRPRGCIASINRLMTVVQKAGNDQERDVVRLVSAQAGAGRAMLANSEDKEERPRSVMTTWVLADARDKPSIPTRLNHDAEADTAYLGRWIRYWEAKLSANREQAVTEALSILELGACRKAADKEILEACSDLGPVQVDLGLLWFVFHDVRYSEGSSDVTNRLANHPDAMKGLLKRLDSLRDPALEPYRKLIRKWRDAPPRGRWEAWLDIERSF